MLHLWVVLPRTGFISDFLLNARAAGRSHKHEIFAKQYTPIERRRSVFLTQTLCSQVLCKVYYALFNSCQALYCRSYRCGGPSPKVTRDVVNLGIRWISEYGESRNTVNLGTRWIAEHGELVTRVPKFPAHENAEDPLPQPNSTINFSDLWRRIIRVV